MLDLRFAEEAEADLKRLYEFLSDIDQGIALRAVDAILADIDMLLDNPNLGRSYEPRDDVREWITIFGANGYIVRYQTKHGYLIVLRIWHSREAR